MRWLDSTRRARPSSSRPRRSGLELAGRALRHRTDRDVPGVRYEQSRVGLVHRRLASADLIMHGAWWRAVTALTLHADWIHLASNALAGLVFMSAVGRWLGGGLGLVLILLPAIAGNFLTAVRHRTHHDSIGASTATFAALGLIAGLQVARRLQLRTRPGYFWVPIGAGLGIFAMIGVAAGTDYWGAPARPRLRPPVRRRLGGAATAPRLAGAVLALAAAARYAHHWNHRRQLADRVPPPPLIGSRTPRCGRRRLLAGRLRRAGSRRPTPVMITATFRPRRPCRHPRHPRRPRRPRHRRRHPLHPRAATREEVVVGGVGDARFLVTVVESQVPVALPPAVFSRWT